MNLPLDGWSVTWIVLPNGFSEAGRARVSLVAKLRVSTSTGELGDSPVIRWPTLVRGLRDIQLIEARTNTLLNATIVQALANQALWDALFSATTPVAEADNEHTAFGDTETSLHYRATLQEVSRLYTEVFAANPEGPVAVTHPSLAALHGLTQWPLGGTLTQLSAVTPTIQGQLARLLGPATSSTASLAEAATLLREQGHEAAAAALPLALAQRRLTYSGVKATNGTPTNPKPSHLQQVRLIDRAEFHQVLGLLTDHPTLALALGLRIDIEIDPFEGERTLRLHTRNDVPLQGSVPVNHPYSRVSCNPRARTFVMASDPQAPTTDKEIVEGMLDLSAEPDGKYVVGTQDLYGATQQLVALAGTMRGSTAPATVALPPRRNAGLVLAQSNRRTDLFKASISKAARLTVDLGKTGLDTILFADDVTAGYRVDISRNGGAFRSLMRRRIDYLVKQAQSKDPIKLSTVDEGMIEALVVTEQYDDTGSPHLLLGEEIFSWDGASLVAGMPGRRVAGEPGHPTVEDDVKTFGPGYPMQMEVVAEPGTLPRLRFGHRYRCRLRAVDLAGNSIDPALCDPRRVSSEVTYHRFDPVLAPVLVPRAPFSFGESLARLVVRSDGAGTVIGVSCERHLVAPKASQRLSEHHGMFDTAMGPRASAADRQRAFTVASHESGHITDLLVPDPDDPTRTLKQPGLQVVVSKGSAIQVTSKLPLQPGKVLVAGEYIVWATSDPHIPYLADPAAAGIGFVGLPGGDGSPPMVRYGGRGIWPDVRPARLVLTAGTAASSRLTHGADGRGLVEVTLPPATELQIRISSAVLKEMVDVFELPPGKPRLLASLGKVPQVSPSDTLMLIHAVSKPLPPLKLIVLQTPSERLHGATIAQLSGTVRCHAVSTDRIVLESQWEEPIDDGKSPPTKIQRSAASDAIVVPAGKDEFAWKSTLNFGDSRRRDLSCRPLGSTRFREYFEPNQLQSLIGEGLPVIIPNASRPEPPVIESVLPLFRWVRTERPDGVYVSTRLASGFRVYLRRPWLQTGVGEQLGVVVFRDELAGTAAMKEQRRVAEFVTRYGTDPVEGTIQAPQSALTLTVLERYSGAKPLALVERNTPSKSAPDGIQIVGFETHYDPTRNLWFSDVGFVSSQSPVSSPILGPGAFVQLALVRYQPESVEGCHVSRVILAEPLQLPPPRQMLVRRGAGELTVSIEIFGELQKNTQFSATLTPRVPGNQGRSVVQDLLQDPGELRIDVPLVTTPFTHARAKGSFVFGDDPSAHDLVVREEQVGESLHEPPPSDARRTLWFEILEGPRLAAMIGK